MDDFNDWIILWYESAKTLNQLNQNNVQVKKSEATIQQIEKILSQKLDGKEMEIAEENLNIDELIQKLEQDK